MCGTQVASRKISLHTSAGNRGGGVKGSLKLCVRVTVRVVIRWGGSVLEFDLVWTIMEGWNETLGSHVRLQLPNVMGE
jgi:hypothetical protein